MKLRLAFLSSLCFMTLLACGEGKSSKPKPEPTVSTSAPAEAPAEPEEETEDDSSSARGPRRGSKSSSSADVTVVKEGSETGVGKVTGAALFSGTPPKRGKISAIANTAGCADHGEDVLKETVIVNDGKLQNVFVYIDKGLEDWEPTPIETEPVTLDQSGCLYKPHVLGVRAGRAVQALNSDDVSHNVHVIAKKNESPNVTQGAGASPLALNFEREEVPVTFVCDIHNWMKAYLCVVEHPFFAVTGPDGSFEIDGLPAGEYTLRTWHEKYKGQKVEFTVGGGGEVAVEFTFK